MDKRGQAMVEYVILLTAFTIAAVEGWALFRPAIGSLYQHTTQRRAGIEGMLP